MYCENCGKKIPDGSQFCPECGAPVRHEEESLITRARRGDNDAIQQLMDQYRGMVRYQARMYVKNEDDVNEIEQQVYIKAFSKTSDLADEKRFGGWLKTIAINTAKDYVTSAFKKRSVMFTDLDDTNNDMVYDASDERVDHRPEVQMDETARQEIIMKVLQNLPQDQQDVIVMHFYNDLSFKEIAEELGVPMSTVTGRAQMAKNSIKASVTAIQDRDGIKLYHLSPIAFFIWLLGLERTAPVQPPVIGKTVRIDPQKVAAKDKPHYGNPENNVGKTVKAEKAVKETAKTTAKKTAETAAKSTAGKAAGTGFLATTAGKVVIAGAIAVAAAGGGTAAVHYHNTKTSSVTREVAKENTDQKQNGNGKSAGKKSESKKEKNALTEKKLVWIKEPGSLDIDDFEDLQSGKSNTAGRPSFDFTGCTENFGTSSKWVVAGNNVNYTKNGMIVARNGNKGIYDFDGNQKIKPSYTEITGDPVDSQYIALGENNQSGVFIDSNFAVKNMEYGYDDSSLDEFADNQLISGDTNLDGVDLDSSTIIPVIPGYKPGSEDVNLKNVSGFKIGNRYKEWTDIPKGMTPTYYQAVEKYIDSPAKLLNAYEYNTCYVNGIIKLMDKDGKIHLWSPEKKKYVTDDSFDNATFYEDGYIGVEKNKKWAFLDKTGNLVSDYLFDKVSGLYEGKAYVKYKGKVGIINLRESLKKNGVQMDEGSDFTMLAGYSFSVSANGTDPYGDSSLSIEIDENGNFTGYCLENRSPEDDQGNMTDINILNVKECSGTFTDLKKTDDTTWTMKCSDVKKLSGYDLTSDLNSYGIQKGQTYTVKTPDTRTDQLSAEVKNQIASDDYMAYEMEQSDTIQTYIIVNDSTQKIIIGPIAGPTD